MFQEKAMHYKEKKRSKTLVILLAVDVCICLCVLLAVWAVFLKEPQAVALAPDYAPSEVEPSQFPIAESDSNNDDTSADDDDVDDGGGRVALSFSEQATISLANKKVSLIFGSGERSLVDIVLQLVVQDRVLAQSGKLTPGNQIETLNLVEGAAELLSEGGYEGQMVLYYYNRDTGERSSFESCIPITVTVQE